MMKMYRYQLKRIIDSRCNAIFTKTKSISSSSSSSSSSSFSSTSHGRPVVSLTNKLNRSYFPMQPGVVTPRRSVPSHILYPEYATTGTPCIMH